MVILFVGCSSRQDETSVLKAFRQNLDISKSTLDQYSITMKKQCLAKGLFPISKRDKYYVSFKKEDEPTCYIDLKDDYLILQLEYIRSTTIIEDILSLALSPITILADVLGSDQYSQYGIYELGVYRDTQDGYLGSIHRFAQEDYNDIVVKMPFNGNFTSKISISIPKFYYPKSAPRIEYVRSIDDKVKIVALDKDGFKKAILYTIKTRDDIMQNERLLMDAIKFDRSIFLEAKRIKGLKINSSILAFPDDADTVYLSENFGKVFAEGKYKSLDGSFKLFDIKSKIFKDSNNVKYESNEYSIDVSDEEVQFKDTPRKNKNIYIDFSKGI